MGSSGFSSSMRWRSAKACTSSVARLLQRGAEARHGLVAELRLREAELVLGGLHGVVELDERVARVVGEVVGGLAGGGIRERRGAAGAGPGRPRPVPATPPGQHVGPAADQRDPSGDEPDGQGRAPRAATRAARRPAGTHPVGERDRGAAPVVGGQPRTDVAGLDVGDDLSRRAGTSRRARCRRRGRDRDGQQCVAPAELRRLARAVRPVLTVAAGEVLHVDDVQAQVALCRSRSSAACTAGVCAPRAPAGSVTWPVTRSGASAEAVARAERQQPEHQRRHRGHPAHVHPRIRLPFRTNAQAVGT